VRSAWFILICIAVAALTFAGLRVVQNDYWFVAGYTVLQFVVLATAWNILGGYCGYVNFGSAAFFALGAYTTVFFYKAYPLPIPLLILIAAVVSGVAGLGMGYLTLRLRGAFFSIATLALAVVLQTLVVNWDYVGGSRGAYIIGPASLDLFGVAVPYKQYLFLLMLVLTVLAIVIARTIERSRLGFGFATIRDDELAAEASGVPTLKLKLIATTLSGALMGMAGAPFPYFIGYLQPASAFALEYAVNSIAMPMIGGTGSWIGPLVGALLLGIVQQVATVTISSAVNLLIVGVLLVAFVVIAPSGIVGLIEDFVRATQSRSRVVHVGVVSIATYCFVLGILEILISIPWMSYGAADRVFSIVGAATCALGIMLLGCAYALLTLQRWGAVLTAASLTISALGGLVLYILHIAAPGVERILLASLALTAISVWFVLRSDVRSIYDRDIGAPVPAAAGTEP
jgi:branched-chain amino acid transport system permease protein